MSATIIDGMPPHNPDAERGVIGGVLRDPQVLPDVLAVVRAESFYSDAHQKLFAAIASLADESAPVDLVSVCDRLRARNWLADAGGLEYVADLWHAVPTGANVAYHAGLVRDCALLRGLIHAANEILRDAYDRVGPAEEVVALAERKLYALAAESRGGAREARWIGDVVRACLEEMDARVESGSTLGGLATGYPDLDHALGGLRPGELCVIGARPSLGKTALAVNLLANVAGGGVPVLLVSLEMPASEIGSRLLSMGSRVPMHKLSRPATLTAGEVTAVAAAASPSGVGGSPFFVDDTPDQTAAAVASLARREVRRSGVQLVAVDYLGLMRPENPRDNRTQQVGTLALRMKNMARDLGVPVLLLSQLNRELEHAGRRPRLSDLRESGDVEAHADRVLLLHREGDLPKDQPVWPVDVIVAKNRNGPTGDVPLAYRRPTMRFESAARGG